MSKKKSINTGAPIKQRAPKKSRVTIKVTLRRSKIKKSFKICPWLTSWETNLCTVWPLIKDWVMDGSYQTMMINSWMRCLEMSSQLSTMKNFSLMTVLDEIALKANQSKAAKRIKTLWAKQCNKKMMYSVKVTLVPNISIACQEIEQSNKLWTKMSKRNQAAVVSFALEKSNPKKILNCHPNQHLQKGLSLSLVCYFPVVQKRRAMRRRKSRTYSMSRRPCKAEKIARAEIRTLLTRVGSRNKTLKHLRRGPRLLSRIQHRLTSWPMKTTKRPKRLRKRSERPFKKQRSSNKSRWGKRPLRRGNKLGRSY
jgi:hypothetical protein